MARQQMQEDEAASPCGRGGICMRARRAAGCGAIAQEGTTREQEMEGTTREESARQQATQGKKARYMNATARG